ncbi:hypothetical protein GDO81_019465 [Engystomops pustulosus]|uniref:Centrobin n=2 Tax=Engystomops pustulosus TaxID=76066 RepID=A0AAV6YSF8_ENGPU|nr:hypothetical protein GDO81_019465 [Engystomops pustulosus]
MRRLREEKEEAEQARIRDQEALTLVEKQLAEALESLDHEKKATKEQQVELQRQVAELTAQASLLQAEREVEEAAREQEKRELELLRQRMQEQQRSWEEREKELLEEHRRVQDQGARDLEAEKAYMQQETHKCQQLQLALSALQGDVLSLERELQTSHRERDTLQMELNLEKARSESEKVRIESEHKMRLEEVITERLSALHDESAQHLCTVREQHRKQLLELTSQHEAELCSQMSQFKAELQERERRHRDVVMDYELKLSHSEERCLELSRFLHRLESERAKMLSQLQDVMKSHWSQALRVLSAKVPSESSSVGAPRQPMDDSEPAMSQLTREGVYGEESSVQAGQGTVAAGKTNRQLRDNTGSHNENDGHVQRSALQAIATGSRHLEDSQRSRQGGNRPLTDSSGSDLINFSRITEERSQSLIGSGSAKDSNLRFMGDGVSNKTKNTDVQVSLTDVQLSGNIGQLGAVDTTSLFSRGSFKNGDLQTLREMIADDVIRKYLADQYMRESYGRVTVDKSQYLSHQEMTDQNKNSSGYSVTRNETLGHGGHQIEGLHQSLMGGRQQDYSERSILSSMDNHQIKNFSALSFTGAPTQNQNLRDSTTVQIHNHSKEAANRTTAGGSNHLSEPGTYLSLDRAPLSIPNLSPISKVSFQGHGRGSRTPSTYREDKISHQPGRGVSDPEESFYPMQVEELSHSFSSHHGFLPLEANPDVTMTGNVATTLPKTFPEHPFHDEPPNKSQETSSHWDGEDQATPNPILQYYIRMLLDRTPGDPLNELDKGLLHIDPDITALPHPLGSRKEQPHLSTYVSRPDEKEQEVSKLPTNPKKIPPKGPEAVKKEVLITQRRPGPSKPLKRVSTRGGRSGIWK